MPEAKMEFGYHPPSGDRGFEVIRPREYLSDLHSALDIASQNFGSLWISDHFPMPTSSVWSAGRT